MGGMGQKAEGGHITMAVLGDVVACMLAMIETTARHTKGKDVKTMLKCMSAGAEATGNCTQD